MIQARTRTIFGTLAALALALPAGAQFCPDPGDTFWKNDDFPQIPSGLQSIALISGMCDGQATAGGEAIAAVFDIPPGMGVQRLKQVAVGFGSLGGGSGATALVNVEIYDGAQLDSGSKWTMGPKVFDLNVDLASDLQVTSTGINTYEFTQSDVEVGNSGMGNYVVAFRMVFNPNGNCTSGYTSTFFTDDPSSCPVPGKNLLDFKSAAGGVAPNGGYGWHDTATASYGAFLPFCPLFIAGDWVIRACTEDVGPGDAFTVGPPTLSLSAGGTQNWFLDAGVGEASRLFLVLGSGNGTAGFPIDSVVMPLSITDPTGYFLYSLQYPNVPPYSNSLGFLDATGQATASFTIGPGTNPALSGLTFHHAFVVFNFFAGGQASFASNAAPLTFTL